MTEPVLISLIGALGVIVASIIGVGGVFLILSHRKNIVYLTRQIEAYHKHEGNLIRELLKHTNGSPSEDQVKIWRGKYRTQFFQEDNRPKMTSEQAKKMRKQYQF